MRQSTLSITALKPASIFFAGRDEDGRWMARDDRGLNGGVFVDNKAAIKFANFEGDRCLHAALLLPEHVKLTLTGKLPAWPEKALPITSPARRRRARSR